MRLEDLIKKVDPEVERIVIGVRKEWNEHFRKQLRSDSRLQLAGAGAREAVPIHVRPGLPLALQKLGDLEVDPQVERLATVRREMECASEDLRKIQIALQALTGLDGNRKAFIADQEGRIEGLRDFFRESLQQVITKSVVRYILEVDEDVLGVYRYGTTREIVLYWAVIGFVAQGLGLDPAGLAGVILAHELAHAYSHLGVDADGRTWRQFAAAEVALKEGLAQYYTHRIAHDCAGRFPEMLRAYQVATPMQSMIYRRHLTWVDRWQLEVVRAAMLEARTEPDAGIAGFEAAMMSHAKRLDLSA